MVIRFKKVEDSDELFGPFETLAELKALTGLENHSKAYIEGVGEYLFRKSSKLHPDGVTIIAPDSGSGRWIKIAAASVNNATRKAGAFFEEVAGTGLNPANLLFVFTDDYTDSVRGEYNSVDLSTVNYTAAWNDKPLYALIAGSYFNLGRFGFEQTYGDIITNGKVDFAKALFYQETQKENPNLCFVVDIPNSPDYNRSREYYRLTHDVSYIRLPEIHDPNLDDLQVFTMVGNYFETGNDYTLPTKLAQDIYISGVIQPREFPMHVYAHDANREFVNTPIAMGKSIASLKTKFNKINIGGTLESNKIESTDISVNGKLMVNGIEITGNSSDALIPNDLSVSTISTSTLSVSSSISASSLSVSSINTNSLMVNGVDITGAGGAVSGNIVINQPKNLFYVLPDGITEDYPVVSLWNPAHQSFFYNMLTYDAATLNTLDEAIYLANKDKKLYINFNWTMVRIDLLGFSDVTLGSISSMWSKADLWACELYQELVRHKTPLNDYDQQSRLMYVFDVEPENEWISYESMATTNNYPIRLPYAQDSTYDDKRLWIIDPSGNGFSTYLNSDGISVYPNETASDAYSYGSYNPTKSKLYVFWKIVPIVFSNKILINRMSYEIPTSTAYFPYDLMSGKTLKLFSLSESGLKLVDMPLWLPNLRSVQVEGTHAVGGYSAAFGKQTRTDGVCSFVSGEHSKALRSYSVAMGSKCIANGDGAFVAGISNKSSSDYSVIFGNDSIIGSQAHGSSIIGGFTNKIDDSAVGSVIFGGNSHIIHSYANFSAILGGANNNIESTATYSVVLGGRYITATAPNTIYMPKVNVSELPIFETNVDAESLSYGDLYRTSTGEVRIKF
jgi:hypothetical protein